VHSGTFTMHGGEIRGNTVTGDGANLTGGVRIWGTLRIVTGVIFGSDEGADSNTGSGFAALSLEGAATAEHGRFDGPGGAWRSRGDLSETDTTIRIVNGALR